MYADQVLSWGPERSAQRNRGAEVARGRYVLMLDSDMVLSQNVVERCIDTARATGAAALVVPEVSIGVGFWAACRALERSCYAGDATIEAARFFERSVYLGLGGYDETLWAGEDWDLAARVAMVHEVGRAKGCTIVHDEGRLRLGPHLRKKYYYGKSFTPYLRQHPDLARAQLTPLRPALLRNRRRLFSRPVLGIGVVALKTAEFGAGGLGLAASFVGRI
jgi:hypothetical protein